MVLPQGSGVYGFLRKPSAPIGGGSAGSDFLVRQSGPIVESQGVWDPSISPAQDLAIETPRLPPAAQAQPAA